MTPTQPAANRDDRILALFIQMTLRRATSEADFDRISALRYRAYRSADMIPVNDARRMIDRFDFVPNVHHIGLWKGKQPVASVRLHPAGRGGGDISPAIEAFPDVLMPQIYAGLMILDPNRLTVDPVVGREDPDLHLALMRIPMLAAIHFGVDLVTATVRPAHAGFFARILRMREAASPRPYPTLLRPLGLMTVAVQQELPKVLNRNRYLQPTENEGEQLFGSLPAQPTPTRQ